MEDLPAFAAAGSPRSPDSRRFEGEGLYGRTAFANQLIELMADRRLQVFIAVARHLSMSGVMAGPLLIGASTTIRALHADVVPLLFVANSEAVQDRIAEHTLDLGFIEGDSHLPHSGQVSGSAS